jgi:hypothetical protein
VYFGLAFGLGSILGSGTCALLAPALIKTDRRWELRLPGLTFAMAAPVFIAAVQLTLHIPAFVAVFLGSYILSVGFAPALAAIQSVAEPRVRATAVAIVMFVSALVGQGGGPTIVGMMSDAFAGIAGAESLRLALSVFASVLLLAGGMAWAASRKMESDLVN